MRTLPPLLAFSRLPVGLTLGRRRRLCVSTGRLGSVSGLSVSTPGAPLPKDMRPEDPDYSVAALVSLNRIYVHSLPFMLATTRN